MIKRSLGERIFNLCNIIFLTLLCVVTIYPLLYVVFASISDPMEFLKHTGILLKPEGFSLIAYERVFAKKEIWSGYGNTLFYTVVGTLINMLLTITLGYGLSKKDLKLVKPITLMIVFSMYFSGGMIPSYILVKNLQLLDTRWAIILPGAISTFNLIIMRTAFENVPQSLEEAALIDGATHMYLLWKIIIPLTMPTIAVLILYYASAHWNAWFNSAIYLRDTSKYPLQLYLRDILISDSQTDMVLASDSAEKLAVSSIIKYATIIVATVPMLLVYPYLQKYFTKGVMVGAVKG